MLVASIIYFELCERLDPGCWGGSADEVERTDAMVGCLDESVAAALRSMAWFTDDCAHVKKARLRGERPRAIDEEQTAFSAWRVRRWCNQERDTGTRREDGNRTLANGPCAVRGVTTCDVKSVGLSRQGGRRRAGLVNSSGAELVMPWRTCTR